MVRTSMSERPRGLTDAQNRPVLTTASRDARFALFIK
ncbi:hypothetical protein LAUMK191_02288 [Mycobacterium attenuatum]|uniref:Uncharacterized protein n=1 Tax=Mycobacterium attenuatum TaxID=2341086 RepID=A0A498PZI9_9MYCO|nr:hypothetical protein LAUMK136_02289 [Mycobacterium attenuatum]VBA51770.1 hypothetical protein LAUMK191_02288 [Mycobacterium attenuatum]VBA57275.1 hypothetical protein LAUMK41_02376 [Mycobacterium attenuatum]